MAASRDGCVARFDGDLSRLNDSMRAGEDYGFAAAMPRTGAYIVGAGTSRVIGRNSGLIQASRYCSVWRTARAC